MNQTRPDYGVHRTRQGMTLVELLVVVSIMAGVAILVIPTLRMVTKERNLREASRVVGAFFQEASSQAKIDGFAGVLIARNPNFYRYVNTNGASVDLSGAVVNTGSRVFYAGYTLYRMRQGVPYRGTDENSLARTIPAGTSTLPPAPLPLLPPFTPSDVFDIQIEVPLDPRVQIVAGSRISFGHSRVRYQILLVSAPFTPPSPPGAAPVYHIRCLQDTTAAAPQGFDSGLSYVIYQRPEVIANSAVQLPRGYFINLNYSGGLDLPDSDLNDLTWTDFSVNRPVVPVMLNAVLQNVELNAQPLVITYDSDGAIDEVYSHGIFAHGWAVLPKSQYRPASPLSFCISSDSFENTFNLSNAAPGYEWPLSFYRAGRDLLNNNDVQWVTLDPASGRVSVSDTVQLTGPLADPGVGFRTQVQAGRVFSARGFASAIHSTKD